MRGSLAGRGVTLALVATSAWLGLRAGGATDPVPAPPRGTSLLAAGPHPVANQETYEIVTRLIDRLRDAKREVPALAAGQAALAGYWRKMQTPWTGLGGDAAALTLNVALVTRGGEEQLVVPLASGGVWTPDPKRWNMDEGAFDDREAIFAPTPSSLTFRLTLPPFAKLSFCPAVVGSAPDAAARKAATFVVSILDGNGDAHDLFTRRVTGEPPGWSEAEVDLSPYAGQSVELRLRTVGVPSAATRAPALALWGDPVILAREPTHLPYNVLWIVVDALRPDVIASLHDDGADEAALRSPHAPLDALLPKVPGLTPAIDDLGARGVRFLHAYSAATWTRPGTIAMLAGARSTELGVDVTSWPLKAADVSAYYGSDPPLLPLLLRRQGVVTRAFVNNFFMTGYAEVGLDLGFARVDDERFRTKDTGEITQHATDWLRAHKDERFFVFCNYNSPHDPYDPPARFLARVPPPPAGPADEKVRGYMAEAAKDDEAIGELLRTIDGLGLRDRTLIVVTADHGETLSSAHAAKSPPDGVRMRFHHALGDFEETAKIPVVLSLPGVLPQGEAVHPRVRSVDLAPTVLELEGMDANPRMSGASLLGLARGEEEPDERVVVTEGRAMRAVLAGRYRLIVRDPPMQKLTVNDEEVEVKEELFDLETDPGERVNLAKDRPDLVLEMRARLLAAMTNVPAAGTAAASAPELTASAPRLELRFAGKGEAHRVSGTLTVGDGAIKATADVAGVGVGPESFRVEGSRIELSLGIPRDGIVGVDLRVNPPGAPVRWELFLDDQPWPAALVYGGPYGLSSPSLLHGVVTDEAKGTAYAARLPQIDPGRDLGLFVVRERKAEGSLPAVGSGESAAEMDRLLRDWGYASSPRAGGKK